MKFLMLKLDTEKAEKPEIKLPTSIGSSKKQDFQKNIYFCFIDYAKAFDCVDHNKLRKFSLAYSLEGLMLKLKLQYFGHVMRRTDSLEKILMLGKIEGGRERG